MFSPPHCKFSIKVFKLHPPEFLRWKNGLEELFPPQNFCGGKMDLRSFLGGIFTLAGLQMLLPMLGVKVNVVLPYQPVSSFILVAICFIIAYYLLIGT